MMCRLLSLFVTVLATLLVVVGGVNGSPHQSSGLAQRTAVRPGIRNGHWVTTWASMPQLCEPANLPPAPFNESGRVFFDSTIRQTLHMSIGGDQIRIRISNSFGTTDLPVTAVTIALPEGGENGGAGTSIIQTKTLETLTFSGSENFTIPNGALAVSDPVNFRIEPESILTVSIYLADGQETNFITAHPGSRTTSFFSSGDHVSDRNLTDPSTQSAAHWYFVSAVETWAHRSSRTFAIVGDSITDGRGSETDKNNRWPDLLLSNMQENHYTGKIGVTNLAAGGNRILNDGLGPNVLSRIDRDVFSQSGVKYAMLFEGVNDIGTADTTEEAQSAVEIRMIAAYKQIVSRIHSFGIPVFGATITPFMAPNSTIQPYSDPTREVTRSRVNEWIRESGVFDAVVDFDKILRDPKKPERLNPEYDSGDFLHPSVAGYQALADAFPLHLFHEFEDGVSSFT